MSYDGKIMSAALEAFERDKQQRQQDYENKVRWIYERSDRVREINHLLQQTMRKLMVGALRRGGDPEQAVAQVRAENLALQQERRAILCSLGIEPDFFEEKPQCLRCGDSGYVQGGICRCLQQYYQRAQVRQLSKMLDLGSMSFDTFSFDWYSDRPDPVQGISPRENMELIYEICSDYAHNFREGRGNLLLTGAPGLGKTFLSACIAREVSDGGFSVTYDTAMNIFAAMEAEKFGRDEGGENRLQRYLDTDLLIMDDLGTEMSTSFVVSAVYQLINHRLMAGKSTIINTNLLPEELGKRYGAAVRSRLEGEYRILPFFGRDIRLQKREL